MTIKKGEKIEEAYRRIKSMIYTNEIAPGQKLISKDLAARLNVSVTPVIQALNRLVAHSDIVRYEPNRGYIVSEITETEAADLYQAREALETYIISSVVVNLDRQEAEKIRKEFRAPIERSSPQYQRIILLKDEQFHLKIAEYAHNSVISRLIKDIFEQIYLKYPPEYLTSQREKEHIKEHRRILESLVQGDIENATAVTKAHIKSGLNYVIKSLNAEKIILD